MMKVKEKLFQPQYAAGFAVIVSVIMIIGKAIAWVLSGSSTMLASLTDSIQDSFLSATNFLAIKYATREADNDHRYGHGKMEGIAALGQAAFMMGSCVFIVLDAVRGMTKSEPITHQMTAIIVIIGAIILNMIVVFVQNRALKQSGSLVIEADRAHYVGDIAIHLGVVVSILINMAFDIIWVDSVIAICITGWLSYLAYHVGKKATDMLMDRELPEAEREVIKTTINRTRGVKHFHDLRTHRHGQTVMMSFDIEVDSSLSFIDAHNIAKRVEDRLHKAYPKSEIMIHVDPAGDITDSRHRKIKKHHVE